MKKVSLLILCLCLSISVYAEKFSPSKATQKAVQKKLKKMSLQEKIGQLVLLDLSNEDPAAINKDKLEEIKGLIKDGKIGGIFNWRGSKAVNELQNLAVKNAAGVPILFGQDVVHGFRTIFPVPLAESASWNLDLIEKTAEIAGIEASAAGIRWTFAPMVDVSFDPRWGRVTEGAGEDPHLASMIAAARVRGFQSNNNVAACVKHFVGYGAPQGGRDYNTANITMEQLYDFYLPPHQAALNAGAKTFMAGFNTLNGVPATSNKFLLTDVLRKDWGFNGFVVSDYNSAGELVVHAVAQDGPEAVAAALNSGTDMDMEGQVDGKRIYNTYLKAVVKDKKVSMKDLNKAVARVLTIKHALGLFDNSEVNASREAQVLGKGPLPEHRQVARQIATESMVLLKNDKVAKRAALLPIASSVKSIAVIGPYANDKAQMLGAWSGAGRFPGADVPEDAVTIYEGIKQRAKGMRVSYAKGIDVENTIPYAKTAQKDKKLWNQALRTAKAANLVVLVLGEHHNASGEGASRASLDLPVHQKEFAQAVLKANPNTVLLVASGRPLSLWSESKTFPSIMQIWHPGIEAGNAVASLVFGDEVPSGKLPMTMLKTVGQVPMHYNNLPSGRDRKDVPWKKVPWMRGYINDDHNTPLYPFGYGLSYSSFEYSNLKLKNAKLALKGEVELSVDVKNTGQFDAKEVIQVYTRDLLASGYSSRPVKELKAFKKVMIRKGETQTVIFKVPVQSLGFHKKGKNGAMKYSVEPGKFQVWVGPSSAEGLSTDFVVAKK